MSWVLTNLVASLGKKTMSGRAAKKRINNSEIVGKHYLGGVVGKKVYPKYL